MRDKLKIGFITISCIILNVYAIKNYYDEERNLFPCSFFDTINITGGIFGYDESITYDGVRYASNHYKLYDYDYIDRSKKIKVKKHYRGCVCMYKKCIRLCCPRGYVYNEMQKDNACVKNESFTNEFLIDIKREDGNITQHNLFNDKEFSPVYLKTCVGWFLEPENFPEDVWEIQWNGNIQQNESKDTFDKDSYCLANAIRTDNEIPVYRALTCQNDYTPSAAVYPFGMLISVPFLIATFIVYAWIKELRATIHGKSLMCYVISLASAFIVLAGVQLNGEQKLNIGFCISLGYLIQTSFIASFLWLNVICFDIWWTFGKGGLNAEKRFLKYSIYAWGTTAIFIFLNFLMDTLEFIPDDFRPGFGKSNCWLQKRESEFFYLFLPVIVIITINVVFFALTANKIMEAQKMTAKVLTRGDSRVTKIQSEKEKIISYSRFGLYIRLFIIMGVTWSMEIISWWVGPKSWVFYLPDTCNCLQGVVIFVLFVWKKRVRTLVAKRLRKLKGLPEQTIYSRSSTTHFSMRETEKPIMQNSIK